MTKTAIMHVDDYLGLGDYQQIVQDYCDEKGWSSQRRTFGDECALIHSEVSEALEAYRNWGSELVLYPNGNKPEGIGTELADVFIRLLDTCNRYGIDLAEQFWIKHTYNLTRDKLHGGKKL